jgi:hypothetical protein
MDRPMSARPGPLDDAGPVACEPPPPSYRAWEYFDLDGYLRASNPVEAAIVRIAKALFCLLGIALAFPLALSHPIPALLGLAVIGLALATGARRYGVWHGECPHCRRELWVPAQRRGPQEFDCRLCFNRILLKSGRFVAL